MIEAEAAPRMAERASKGEKRQMAARMVREGRMEGWRVTGDGMIGGEALPSAAGHCNCYSLSL